jgi:FMN phosphatase YigB (HAD superfamily)
MIEMTERQMHRVSEAFLTRVKAEYAEMPGLCLTVAQAARLWHVTTGTAESALRALVETGYLRRRFDGVYALTEGGFSPDARGSWTNSGT